MSMTCQGLKEKDNHTVKILLEAHMAKIPFPGWSLSLLQVTAEENQIPSYLVRELFPYGEVDMFLRVQALADEAMTFTVQEQDFKALRIRDRIAACIEARLLWLMPYRAAVKSMTRYLWRSPTTASKIMYRTVDQIWYLAGDQSTDYNFYTKRGLLAIVYSRTLHFWLNETISDYTATREFCEKRIAEVLALPQLPQKIWEKLRGFCS